MYLLVWEEWEAKHNSNEQPDISKEGPEKSIEEKNQWNGTTEEYDSGGISRVK